MNTDRFIRTESNVYYLSPVAIPAPSVEPEVTHHVFVVDRSGSMWNDIEGLKASIEQALAVESLLHSNVETTLISFSSHGDVTVHWSHVPADKVTELSGPYITELRSIRATCLTGISQAMNLALDHVKEGQTTGVTLFTDGYANDPSASAENKSLDAFVRRAEREFPNVFVNTIGYRDWCDWPRMNAIASALSGKCVKAGSFKDVLNTMRDTQALLAGRVRPAIRIKGEQESFTFGINFATGQVNAAAVGSDLVLRGVGAEDRIDVFRVVKGEPTYNLPKGVRVIDADDAYLAGALALGFAGMGSVRSAKEILFASGNKTLWAEHQAAMTPTSIAAMTTELCAWVQAGNNDGYEMGKNVKPKHNLFDLADAINALPPRSVGIDADAFYSVYRRRSIKKIPGTREADGSVTPPNAELVARDGARTFIKGMTFNKADASVQIDTEKAVWVKRLADGKVFTEVEFVSLDGLRDYRSFTVLSSGERNVDVLPIEVYTKEAWTALTPFMIPSQARDFAPGDKAKIELKRFRMEAETVPTPDDMLAAIKDRFTATAETKILSAMQDKAAASPFTPEQIAALKDLHLSPALYFSAPSTNHYTDKDEAIRTGKIDSFTRYKINFGTVEIPSTDEFRSGNAFLDRRYAVEIGGAAVSKPKLDTYLQGATYTVKPPSPKAKDTAADAVMATVADAILLSGSRMTNDEITSRLRDAKRRGEKADALFQGLVMEIGCTGLLPVEIEKVATRYEPADYAAKYGVKLGKDEQDGIFYVLANGIVISITPEVSWYTVSA
jgi:hypothetical protein